VLIVYVLLNMGQGCIVLDESIVAPYAFLRSFQDFLYWLDGTHAYTHIYARTHIHTHTHVHIHIHTYIHTYIHTHTDTFIASQTDNNAFSARVKLSGMPSTTTSTHTSTYTMLSTPPRLCVTAKTYYYTMMSL